MSRLVKISGVVIDLDHVTRAWGSDRGAEFDYQVEFSNGGPLVFMEEKARQAEADLNAAIAPVSMIGEKAIGLWRKWWEKANGDPVVDKEHRSGNCFFCGCNQLNEFKHFDGCIYVVVAQLISIDAN